MRETPQAATRVITQPNEPNTLTPVSPALPQALPEASAKRPRRKGGRLSAEVRRAAQDIFLLSYARLGNVTVACKAANVNRETIYAWLEKDTPFAEAFKRADADAADMLYAEAFRRAVQGVEKTVVSMGRVVYVDGKPLTEREYSDTLLLNLLRARDPRFRIAQPADGVSATASAQMQVIFMLPPQGTTPDGAQTVEADALLTSMANRQAIELPSLDE